MDVQLGVLNERPYINALHGTLQPSSQVQTVAVLCLRPKLLLVGASARELDRWPARSSDGPVNKS